MRPGSTAEVAAVVARCAEHGAPSCPRAATPASSAAACRATARSLLSLARLTELGAVDVASAQVDAGAGVTLAALQAHARAAGLDAGVDFAARDSATVGGLVATDAGGIRALRHGTVRARVAGLEAVLADGSVVDRTSGLLKDNAGYDLPALLVGSEGTLGVVTRVRWRLVAAARPARRGARAASRRSPRPRRARGAARRAVPGSTPPSSCSTTGSSSSSATWDPVAAARAQPRLRARRVRRRGARPTTSPTPSTRPALGDAVVADDTAGRERLWRVREHHTEAIAAAGRAPQARRRRAAGPPRRRSPTRSAPR